MEAVTSSPTDFVPLLRCLQQARLTASCCYWVTTVLVLAVMLL
jgi:hypothetical protein